MSKTASYSSAAQAYVEGVRALLAPPVTGTREIGAEAAVRQVAPPADLAAQAEQLAPLSAGLTRAAADQLADPDPAVRADASVQLLAKALTDLQVSAHLLRAAMQEEPERVATRGAEIELELLAPDELAESLDFLLSQPGALALPRVRAVASLPADVSAARVQLAQTVGDALDSIRDRAGRTGQAAIGGLVGLGISQVAAAAGVVGMDIAVALGVAEPVSRLYALIREFALNAYNSLIELLGPTIAKAAVQQAVTWIKSVSEGEQFGKLLEKLYETQEAERELGQTATASQTTLERFVKAIQDVDALNGKYGQQIGLIEKLLKGLRLLGSVPVAAMPQGRLLMAAAYLVVSAYVILAGADYVDAPRLKILNRVPGVRTVVVADLIA